MSHKTGFWGRLLGRSGKASDVEMPDEVIKFVGVPSSAPTIYADSCVFLAGIGPNARLQFIEAIPGALDSTDPGTKMRYVVNVVMPEGGLTNMIKYVLSVMPEETRKEILNGF